MLALAEVGDVAAANALFQSTRGCRDLILNTTEQAEYDRFLSTLGDPATASTEARIMAVKKGSRPHCANLPRWQADQEVYVTLLAARLGNSEARVHYWLVGEPGSAGRNRWERARERAAFEREANALLDAAVADGDGMALSRRAESYREGRYVSADPVRAYAFSYAQRRRRGPLPPEGVAELREAWARDLSPEALSRAEALGEEIFQQCCTRSSQPPRG